MVLLFRFRTGRFDPAAEDPNPINPIPGQAVLRWLAGELRARGYEPSEVEPEDWGWLVYVPDAGWRHLVGASGEPAAGVETDWTLQIHRQRSLWEKLRGAHPLDARSSLVLAIEELLRGQPDFSGVEREAEA